MRTSFTILTCADARPADAGREVSLCGWVHRRRDLGQLVFLDLRDRYGITQVVVDATEAPAAHEAAAGVRSEYVLQVRGVIRPRLPGTENPRLATGEVELRAHEIRVLAAARTPPFVLNEPDAEVDESLRLRYRYLDLRREALQARIVTRGRLVQAIRDVHQAAGFVEVETPPLLIKSTPEGARDFIVPSRLQQGSVYALPQSPQQLKQLLMVSGMDRYFQIARCFRDEDLRGDRQPEFTQLDLEMSFVAEDDVMAWVEDMACAVTRAVVPERPIAREPFPRLTWREAIDRYGSDKPDLRYGLEIGDLAAPAAASGFRVFSDALATGGRVVGLAAPGLGGASRSLVDELTEVARAAGARGLVWVGRDAAGAIRGSIVKLVGEGRAWDLAEACGAGPGDLALIVAGPDIEAHEALGKLRVEVATRLGLADPAQLSYAWVHHFPMYQWDAERRRWDATHNPFSGVVAEDEALLTTTSGDLLRPDPSDPAGRARALQYDLVLNGLELGGGSIRFHRREMLSRSFSLMGLDAEAQAAKFGGILEAFEYGAPPHGGIALGVDRWAMVFTGQTNIREVMAFPKTSSGSDLMLGAPSPVDPAQLSELGLRLETRGLAS